MNVACAAAEMVLPLMSEKCKCAAAGRAATPPSHTSGKTKRNKKSRKEMPLSPFGSHGNKASNKGTHCVVYTLRCTPFSPSLSLFPPLPFALLLVTLSPFDVFMLQRLIEN